MALKKNAVVKNYYILPCCLLLLNLCNTLISYKAAMIDEPLVRTGAVILLVLFGSSVVTFAVAPAIEALVRTLHRSSRRGAGELGEILFLALLGVGVFWVYYLITINGPEAVLPREWRNPKPAQHHAAGSTHRPLPEIA